MHRASDHSARPAPVIFLHPRRTDLHVAFYAARFEFALQRRCHHLRQRLQSPAHKNNFVPLPRVPCHSLDSFFIEQDGFEQLKYLIRTHAAQVELVSVSKACNSLRPQPQRFHAPSQIIGQWNRAVPAQSLKKTPLQRWLGNQRAIHVEECAHSIRVTACGTHAAPLCADRRGFVLERFPAKNFQPSSSTGKPRTTQNAAVTHARICAPARIAACTSSVIGPSNCTGPCVSAISNPR